MKWPWQRDEAGSAAVIGGTPEALVWLRASAPLGRAGALQGGGRIERNGETTPELARRLRALGLPTKGTLAVLPFEASQLLQIEAPKVAPDELKAAARWHVKDLVEQRLDELTLDVMPVGDERAHGARHLFVAAARSSLIRQRVELAAAAGIELTVVDIVESAQRNLQCALAAADGLEARATAALTRHGGQALLTICAAGELFYARRLEGLDLRAPAAVAPKAAEAVPAEALELPAFVDYGAEPEADDRQDADEPRLVIELQRSFDVWERTWRELPLARLWIDLGEDTAPWIQRLGSTLGLAVEPLEPERLFPGFDAIAASPALREALLPLAGALLRHEKRSL